MAAKNPYTAETAKEFAHHSATNSTTLETISNIRGCTCKPYTDWFTYNRWQAQGFQVQKGEHGTKIGVQIVKDENGKEVTQWTRSTVFCRCQVKEITKQ